jgi:cytochrome b6-f complex iron-sulfur subunit
MTLDHPVTRRTVLAAGAAGAGAIALAGCGSSNKPSAGAAGTPSAGAPAATPTKAAGGTALAKVADVPVGGAVAATAADGSALIIAQPAAGTVVAFSAKCTHMGCTVAPAGKHLNCPCHGSVYDAATGKVINGPAPKPLAKVDVHVASGEVLPGSS